MINRLGNDSYGLRSSLHLINCSILVFEVLINLKEVSHLVEYVLGQLINADLLIVIRVIERNGNNLLIEPTIVYH